MRRNADLPAYRDWAPIEENPTTGRSAKGKRMSWYYRWWGGDDAIEMYNGIFGKSYW